MKSLLKDIRACQICAPYLEHGVNPVLAVSPKSKIAIIGQAPGRIVHETGVPWDDKSGERLRDWLKVSNEEFYNPDIFAIIPMGFCYPGQGESGDLPPRKECAPKWHSGLWEVMQDLKLTILIGSYAQNYYLSDTKKKTLTETVKSFRDYTPKTIVLPHPSPRNNIWLKKNPWFATDLLPYLRRKIKRTIRT